VSSGQDGEKNGFLADALPLKHVLMVENGGSALPFSG